jgi:hypothetical protein
MIELDSGIPAPQFVDESGSRFKRFLCFVLIDVTCFRLPPGVRVPQVEYHQSK